MPSEIVQQVADAYEHLYDLVYLADHPLTAVVLPQSSALPSNERAWALHQLLLKLIEQLKPELNTPVLSREWRLYRLMALRYGESLDPQTVADRLAISRRHYYREHDNAIRAIANLLLYRQSNEPAHESSPSPSIATDATAEATASRLELLRLEVARASQAHRYAPLGEVIQGVAALLKGRPDHQRLRLHVELSPSAQDATTDRNLLRQILFGLLAYLVDQAAEARFRIEADAAATTHTLELRITLDPVIAGQTSWRATLEERLSPLREIASLGNINLSVMEVEGALTGFQVVTPLNPRRIILIVDDNRDAVALAERRLTAHGYMVVAAQTSHEALSLAERMQPFAILLDLMLPDQDGWDLMQVLHNHPQTQHIPVVICTVLRQKELALSFGAAAFLEKPVTEETLLSVLRKLDVQ